MSLQPPTSQHPLRLHPNRKRQGAASYLRTSSASAPSSCEAATHPNSFQHVKIISEYGEKVSGCVQGAAGHHRRLP